MKADVFLLDFQDSFTFQIYSELLKLNLNLNIKVIPLEEIEHFLNEEKRGYYILGPGPGHPQDYKELYPSLHKILNNHDNQVLGICLGHQIICHLKGFSIQRSKHPTHGMQIKYHLEKKLQRALSLPEEIYVQRYNSLAVMALNENPTQWPELKHIHDDELVIAQDKNILSFQFHPESIGTVESQQFFLSYLGGTCL
ncbi:MAG: hypothetical protein CME62_03685 [Halobacteriovoraceae bacterium]|nr:hypothetical protein [Halobacteriovoraceae bacterium]|tara:strand:+ start:5087 stop:5677 length:591 start_codon:yes stop_codon:yes gene_type:complete